MASLVISDPNGELRVKVKAIAAKMAENAREKGMVIKVRHVDVIRASLELMEQKLHVK